MPNAEHQIILLELAARIKTWLQETKMGRVMVAPHPIRLWPGKYREPDVMIWRTENLHRIGEKDSGPPDLAVEIHSPSNPELDQETKFQEYARAGIPEYWMIDPQSRAISVYSLENHTYKLVNRFRSGDRATSFVLAGFEAAVDDLFPAK
jgi:Uma2 family endonuclease